MPKAEVLSPKYKDKIIKLLRDECEDRIDRVAYADSTREKKRKYEEELFEDPVIQRLRESTYQAQAKLDEAETEYKKALISKAINKGQKIYEHYSTETIIDCLVRQLEAESKSEQIDIRTQFRKLETRVNAAKTEEQINNVLKEAGLL